MTTRKNIRNKVVRFIAMVLIVVMAMSVQLFTSNAAIDPNYIITVEDLDENLIEGIKDTYDLENLTAGIAESMEEISMESKYVESLEGVEKFFPNLKKLSLYRSNISSFNGILNLKKLEELNLAANKISRPLELVVLKDSLKKLDLSYCPLEVTDGLGELTNLTYLNLFRTTVYYIIDLTKLTKLDKDLNKSSFIHNRITWGDLMLNLPSHMTSDLEYMEYIASNQMNVLLYIDNIFDANATYKKEGIYNGTKAIFTMTRESSKRIVCNFDINPKVQDLKDIEFWVFVPEEFRKDCTVYDASGNVVESKYDENGWDIIFKGDLGKYTLVIPGEDTIPTIKPTPKPTTIPTIKLSSVKPGKLTTKVKKITGVTTSKATVKLMNGKKTIKKVIAKSNGKFSISGLKLKKYKNKKLKLIASKSKYKNKSKIFAKIKK